MNRLGVIAAVLLLGTLSAPAIGQDLGYDGPQFVEAIKSGNSEKAVQLLQKRPIVVNARDGKGNTALIYAIQRRDERWTALLLQQDADPNLPGAGGETPLIAASRIGYEQAAEWLIGLGAKVNADNRMGETALIAAVQGRHVPVVRLLLRNGADPDKTDSAQGFSARDYARRDTRSTEILRLIEARKPRPAGR